MVCLFYGVVDGCSAVAVEFVDVLAILGAVEDVSVVAGAFSYLQNVLN